MVFFFVIKYSTILLVAWRTIMGKRVAFIVAEGTELTECIATMDVLRRAGIEISIFGCEYTITHNVTTRYEIFSPNYFDAIVFPGGGLGVKNVKEAVRNKKDFRDNILKMKEDGKLIAAICAAPSILGEIGLLKGKRYTCYPGFSSDSFEGKHTGSTVEVDGKLITARSMYYSVDFGLAILENLMGKEKRIEIEEQVKGLKPKNR